MVAALMLVLLLIVVVVAFFFLLVPLRHLPDLLSKILDISHLFSPLMSPKNVHLNILAFNFWHFLLKN